VSAADPAALQQHYTRFRVAERLLLSGHSHQAWPDVSEQAHAQAWADAAEHVDAKWALAEAQAEAVRAGYARLLGDPGSGQVSLGASTHDLLVRLLSALDWSARPRIVTTDGEFHSARRQLARLREAGADVEALAAEPVEDLANRLADAVDDRTGAVLVSKVLYGSGRIVPDLAPLAERCRRHGTLLVVDAYHAVNVLDWGIDDDDLGDAFVVGGGYKYVQAGEGACFLRWPTGCALRPVVTGWFAEFGDLEAAPAAGQVAYGTGPERFAGATYDPTAHYRAARVLQFFQEQSLTPTVLRELSQHQVGRLRDGVHALDPDPATLAVPDVPLASLGGFLALSSPHAGLLRSALEDRGVRCDHRGEVLRLGPAPYVTDGQLDDAVAALGEALASLATGG
jgi:kynureninase